MTGVDDWISSPLTLVQGLFVQNGGNKDWEKKVTEYFQEKLQENNSSAWVPCLNDVPLHYLKPNSLVKFRCLIQDMFDPEFFMGVYETVDQSTNSRVLHFGKYRDIAECAPQQEVDLNSNQTVTSERQTFYCVPVPGESNWVKEGYASSSQARVCASTSYTPNRQKRSYEEDEEMGPRKEQHTGELRLSSGCGETKRLETEAPAAGEQHTAAPNCATSLDLNFPLPGEKGPACLVKVYENWDSFKVNDVLEVYGILSVDPILSCVNEERDSLSALLDPAETMDTSEEHRVHSPPTSLVPRIHAILAHKLQHNNPLLPPSLEEPEGKLFVSSFMSELSSVRAELLGFLTHVLLGDSLAAEYLILHLISTVYARRDVLPLGKFTLNLSGCLRNGTFSAHLYQILQQLVPASYYLSMTIENMNSLRFIPQKDYSANRLVSGLLQLSTHTSLLVDETVLEQGQLDTQGVHNVTALGNLITWQKVDYDFSYHRMEFPCNINVLVTSEGRSLLPSDCQVHLKPEITPPNPEQYMSALLTASLPSMLNKFRVYLTLLRQLDYSISDEVTKAVEDDFVDMRKNDPQSISADDLHRLLVVARLLSLSAGQTTLSRERWLRAKQLEMQRKNRLLEHKFVNGNEL
ncbi:mini-chromosome maintenance complex-binding protein [Bombina bombina]|uniref:mini-chromosome maintenance complex-binding protein n=1 Tax=Bombina bombina TaxID=8345 RepID=UPI00235AA49A|nr:mini-chromosome maintenance complex-binding protein [Bombina bombina]